MLNNISHYVTWQRIARRECPVAMPILRRGMATLAPWICHWKPKFTVLSSWQGHCKSLLGSCHECILNVKWPPTFRPSQSLEHELWVRLFRLLLPVSTVIIVILSLKADTHFTVPQWVSSVLRPHQHSIGYTGDGFYRSKHPTNSIKVLKEMLQKRKKTTKTTKYRYT